MRLASLLDALPENLSPERVVGPPSPTIRGMSYDSRGVVPGDLFVAMRGADSDGHDYLGQALEHGASALLVESLPSDFELGDGTAVQVSDTRRALAPLSCCFFGNPAADLKLVGVTGTNGKTSTTYLVESMLQQSEASVGLIGTVEIRYAGERERTLNTTPESLDLQRTLRAMHTRGVRVVAMEVSSHGLELGRVDGCEFDVAALTNLTPEHLDFHGDMDAYRASKALLFRRYLRDGGCAVINLDDAAADSFLQIAQDHAARVITTSADPQSNADVVLEESNISLDGTRAQVRLASEVLPLELPLLGEFNLENLRVALGIGLALGLEPSTMAEGVRVCPQVPGRIQRVEHDSAGAPTILVDYAHTSDAIEKLLRTVRPLAGARLITVFGCGGDRDRSKRPMMAEAVARWSDQVVATSDNPRTEDPLAILADVESGLGKLQRVQPGELAEHQAAYCVEPDRRTAIELAVGIAQREDIVVLAGKGHEDYQIIGRKRLPFDDREEALRALRTRTLQ